MSTLDERHVRDVVRQVVERHLGIAASTTPAVAAPAAEPAETAVRPGGERRVALGSDHGGFALKEILKRVVEEELGWLVQDCGTHSADAVDYPDYAAAVAREVAGGRCARGIVVDAAGIGSTMAANKIAGARCALCHDDLTAVNARAHNDANVLALGSRVVNRGLATRLVKLFLATPFEGGRHERRVRKIDALDRTRPS